MFITVDGIRYEKTGDTDDGHMVFAREEEYESAVRALNDNKLYVAQIQMIPRDRFKVWCPEDWQRISNGIYRIEWKSGGISLASVGCNAKGDRWYAPTNWITVPWYDWTPIQDVHLIQAGL